MIIVVATVFVAAVAACGGGRSSPDGSEGANSPATYNAGVGKVCNPSNRPGGTLRMGNSGDWDSFDPANTYYTYSLNFVRLYGRSLTMFAPAPGPNGAGLVPDLAESLGTPGDGAKTWTYRLRRGVKFEDGTPVTSKDVKYAVERAIDKNTFSNGPTYFNDYLDLRGYTSPYADSSADRLGLTAIDTPDDRTVVFHLSKAFGEFDFLAQLPATIPVPRSKDTGARYQQHVVSTGPYKFADNQPGKDFTLIRNEQWSAASDPNRRPLPDKITVQLNLNADDIDNQLLSGDLDVAVEGNGVGPAAQARILADPTLKAHADSAATARLWFTAINGDVAPLNDLHCRRAVEYAADKVSYQRAYGGPTGGDIATNLMPPVIPGAQQFDRYPSAGHTGDLVMAKNELARCGRPNGFSTNISYRSELRREKAAAEALQQSLARAGIELTLKPYPGNDYYSLYAGNPGFAKANRLGLMLHGWGADWPNGFGFLTQIVDSRVIRAAGNSNLGVKDPAVDALVDKALGTTDVTAKQKVWADVDRKVMDDAFILPGVWARGLLYRPPNLTNVFISDGFQMYDYLALGLKPR